MEKIQENMMIIKERAMSYGMDSLTNNELLMLLSNKKDKTQIDEILKEGQDIIDFFNSNTMNQLVELFGKNAFTIKSITELYKRRNFREKLKISNPKDIFNLLCEDMMYRKQEVLVVLHLNTKNALIGKETIFKGSLNTSIVHPREIFNSAIKNSAASIVIAHNHPSSDPTPSKEDVNITHRIVECSKILGIALLDHIIVAGNKYVSLKEKGLL